ncbi:Alpha amylase, catalytic domain [Kosakonia sacchari]|nr:Alpha amylase, catalytic domain [Kosakonia sacchari]
MRSDWYKNAVIYQIDTPFFLDGNGDGCGDLQGIRRRLDYIRGLGATVTLFYLTPFLDGGYDVQDHLQSPKRNGVQILVGEICAGKNCRQGNR